MRSGSVARNTHHSRNVPPGVRRLCKSNYYANDTNIFNSQVAQVALTLVGQMTAVVTTDAGPRVEGRSLLGLGVLGLSPLATPGLTLIIRLQQLQRLRQLQQLQRLQQVQLLLGGGRPALGNNEDRRPAYTPGTESFIILA